MDEAQALADRVAVMAGGRLVGDRARRPSSPGATTLPTEIRFALPAGIEPASSPSSTATCGADGAAVLVTTPPTARALHHA